MVLYLKCRGSNNNRIENSDLYLNVLATQELRQSKVHYLWSFGIPAEAIQTNTIYFLEDLQGKYFTANNKNEGVASLSANGGIPYPYTNFVLQGKTFAALNGTSDSVQIKVYDSSIYIIGMQRDIAIQSFKEPKTTYKWVVLDNGDGTASFQSWESNGVEFILKGWLLGGGNTPMLQSPGSPDPGATLGRRWKFTKNATAIAPSFPRRH